MTRLELSIAWRYLRSRRGSRLLSLISVIAIGGVLVGVSALIVIMGVMNGMQRDLREKILVGSPDVRVLPYGDAMRLANWREIRERVSASPGVVKAAPYVATQALVRNPAGYPSGAQIVGIEPAGTAGADVTAIRDHAILGDFSFRRAGVSLPGAVLGKLLASKLNSFPGDTIIMLVAAGLDMNASTGAVIPREDSLVVSGVFETGMFDYDDSYMYIDLATAQRFAGLGDDVTGIEVSTGDRGVAPIVADSLRTQLGSYPVFTRDWQEQNRSLFQALKLERLGMAVILLLIVVVAAFNIVSTLTMVVADKTREIGILRAMGMPARSIRRIFFYQGLVVGAVGTGGGLLLGLLVAVALEKYQLIRLDPSIYMIDHLPVTMEISDVVVTVIASLSVAALATLYPAAQAARLYPVEAIRHE